jgi:hypothetical protein
MRIKAIKCENCNDIVYSRAEQDYRECECAQVGAFGGQSYAKYNTHSGAPHEKMIISLDITPQDLYNDWKEMRDRYGLIKATSTAPIPKYITC